MPFIIKTDLTSIIYLEDIDAITEGDDSKVDTAINAAIAESKGYLDRYDTDILYARTGIDRDPILFESCKAIAVWYLIAACPANQNTKDVDTRSSFARAWLGRVQNGKQKPINWPLKTVPESNTFFHVDSLPKRNNNY